GVYHDQLLYQLRDGSFAPKRMEQALRKLVQRHEILRTSFYMEETDRPIQVVWRQVELPIEEIDLRDQDETEQSLTISAHLEEDRKRPFNMKKGPLWRMKVFYLGREQVVLGWIVHHALMDGWSVASFMTELIDVYFHLAKGEVQLPELGSRYVDFVAEEQVLSGRESWARYWKEELEGYKRLELPTVGKGSSTLIRELEASFLPAIKELARREQTTPKTVALSAYLVMMHLMSYDSDLTVGLIENNRPQLEDGEQVLGCFLNTVPFRVRMDEVDSYRSLLRYVHAKHIELKQYGRYPFQEIVRAIGERSGDENPVTDVLFNFVDFHVYDRLDERLGFREESFERTNTLFDFTLSTTYDRLEVRLTSAMPQAEAERWVRCYERILSVMLEDPAQEIDKYILLDEDERNRLFEGFNDTRASYPRDATLVSLFEEQAARQGDRVAVKRGERVLTYRELNEEANRLAHALRERGLARE
ncbi:condensation domain-containing protein, partial [Kroppenstedtia guangzhouensis]|uniref:condensation domain-containing protein n=1 Tax=Kroppenstedtia guangzhouensis TaxID=1274356 RepID=UPI001664EC8E